MENDTEIGEVDTCFCWTNSSFERDNIPTEDFSCSPITTTSREHEEDEEEEVDVESLLSFEWPDDEKMLIETETTESGQQNNVDLDLDIDIDHCLLDCFDYDFQHEISCW